MNEKIENQNNFYERMPTKEPLKLHLKYIQINRKFSAFKLKQTVLLISGKRTLSQIWVADP